MQQYILIGFVLWTSNLLAQPGCIMEETVTRQFTELTKKIALEPNNYTLVWERIHLNENALCNKTIVFNSKQEQLVEYTSPTVISYKIDVIAELSALIKQEITIERKREAFDVNKYNFFYKRGQYYYSKKDTLQALEDYHSALKTSNKQLKKKVVEAIVNHYLSCRNGWNGKTYERLALKYIDLVSPVEFKKALDGTEEEAFPRLKKELLNNVEEYARQEQYLIQLIEYSYLKTKQRSNYERFLKNSGYEGVLENMYALAAFYFDRKAYGKAKQIIEHILPYLPDDTFWYVYNHSYIHASKFALLNKIYQTEAYQNQELEMHYLMQQVLADPLFNNFSQGVEYLEALIKKYPTEPRVYLVWALFKINDGCIRKQYRVDTNYPLSIEELFEKVEKMRYKGYEWPYSKAWYYSYTDQYEMALKNINKALLLYQGAKLLALKNRIRKKLPNPPYKKIEQQDKAIKKDYFEYKDLSLLIEEVKAIAKD